MKEDTGVRFVLKELPLLGDWSLLACRAALAAKAQGAYDRINLELFRVKGGNRERKVMDLAAGLGLDMERFQVDLESAASDAVIERNKVLAKTLGAWKTPSMVVGDRIRIGGAKVKHLRAIVAGLRAGPV